jgi:hypothetical protein
LRKAKGVRTPSNTKKQPSPLGFNAKKDRGLKAVRVLVLVDEHMVEALADFAGKARIADHLRPLEQQIVIIEDILSLLRLDIGMILDLKCRHSSNQHRVGITPQQGAQIFRRSWSPTKIS